MKISKFVLFQGMFDSIHNLYCDNDCSYPAVCAVHNARIIHLTLSNKYNTFGNTQWGKVKTDATIVTVCEYLEAHSVEKSNNTAYIMLG